MNAIENIISSWSNAVDKKDVSAIQQAIHDLAEQIHDLNSATKTVAEVVFKSIDFHKLSDKKFGLKLIKKEDNETLFKDIGKILLLTLSHYQKINFRGSELGNLYTLWQSFEVNRLLSKRDFEGCMVLIQEMKNLFYKNELSEFIFTEYIKNSNFKLNDNFSEKELKFICDLIKFPNNIEHLNKLNKTKLFEILIEKKLLDPSAPFDALGTPFAFWAIDQNQDIIPYLIKSQGDEIFSKTHNDLSWVEKIATCRIVSDPHLNSEILTYMGSSESGRNKFAIINQARFENAIKYSWPLNLILQLLPKAFESNNLEGVLLHNFVEKWFALSDKTRVELMNVIIQLVNAGVNLNGTDKNGKTLLDLQIPSLDWQDNLCYQPNFEFIKGLIKLGGKTTTEKPILFHLWNYSSEDTASLIKDDLLDINIQDNEGNTLLHTILDFDPNQLTISDPSLSRGSIFNSLILRIIELGINPHLPNNAGKTAFYKALKSKDVHDVSLVKMNASFVRLYFKNPLQGSFPLHEAILKGDSQSIKLLLNNPDLDINQADDDGVTPLHLAVDRKNELLIAALIEKGAYVHNQDKIGITPLHLAVLHDSLKITDRLLKSLEQHSPDKMEAALDLTLKGGLHLLEIVLLNKNVDLLERLTRGQDLGNFRFHIISNAGLRLRVGKKDKEMLKILIERGKLLSQNEVQVLLISPFGRVILDLFKKRHPNLSILGNLNQVKSLGHALSLNGLIIHTNGTNIQPNSSGTNTLHFEGGQAESFMSNISKATTLFFKDFPEIPFPCSIISEIKYMLNFGADIHSYSSEQIIRRINKNIPVILNTGFYMHSVEVLFTKDASDKPVLVLGNRGAKSRRPVELYHYDPSMLTPELINKIQDLSVSSSDEFCDFFFIQLKSLLSLESSESLKEIERHCPLEPQIVGNCSWTSIEAVIWAQFQFAAQRIELGSDRVDILEYANSVYIHWQLFVTVIQVENYLESLKEQKLLYEKKLLSSFQKLWRMQNNPKIDKKLRQRIFELNKRCFDMFPNTVENPAPNAWIRTQKVFWNQWENLNSLIADR
jgi:ankyrin repeat protein